MDNVETQNNSSRNANRRVLAICCAVITGMGILTYKTPELYQLFCQVTGYGGTTQRADITDTIDVIDREITVRFDANTAKSLNWEFAPQKRSLTMKLGEKSTMNYIAKNLSDKPLTGHASFNVSPQATGTFFNKIECFCFTDTHIEPGETLVMPVVFYVDPELDKEKDLKQVQTITLSYTFFENKDGEDEIAVDQTGNKSGSNSNGNL